MPVRVVDDDLFGHIAVLSRIDRVCGLLLLRLLGDHEQVVEDTAREPERSKKREDNSGGEKNDFDRNLDHQYFCAIFPKLGKNPPVVGWFPDRRGITPLVFPKRDKIDLAFRSQECRLVLFSPFTAPRNERDSHAVEMADTLVAQEHPPGGYA